MSARDERVTLAIRETVAQHFILTDLRGKPLYCKCRNWSVEDPDAPYPAHRAHLASRLRLAVAAALVDDPAQATLARVEALIVQEKERAREKGVMPILTVAEVEDALRGRSLDSHEWLGTDR